MEASRDVGLVALGPAEVVTIQSDAARPAHPEECGSRDKRMHERAIPFTLLHT